jgi:hypothetical protein
VSVHKLTQRSAVVMIRETTKKSILFLANACNDFENCDLLKVTQVDDELGQTLTQRSHFPFSLLLEGLITN